MNHTKSQIEAAHKRAQVFGGSPESHLPSESDLACIVRNTPLKGFTPVQVAAQVDPLGTAEAIAKRDVVVVKPKPWEQVIMDESGTQIGSVPAAAPTVTVPERPAFTFEDGDPGYHGCGPTVDKMLEKARAAFSGNTSGFVTRDSGKRSEFSTGAVRDTPDGKGRFDLISPIALKRLAQLYERGAKKYGARNWEKGIPLWRYLDSAERHLNDFKTGDRVEDHLSAVAWNMFCYVHTEQLIAEGKLPASLAEDRPNEA